ncbi:hypothetical protein [Photobacterium nomapromontoriensis]|uniref:hypothetical protein n=1 Tax=Photobacterium nomapromontoriensis TaxID=2910237 RepID=UPI003D0D3B47
MRRKRLNHYSDVLCKMFVGWRMGDDLEALSELPNGVLVLDLINASATHSEVGQLRLWISGELSEWLKQTALKENIDISKLNSVTLSVYIDTDKVKTHKKKVVMFHFDYRTEIMTNSKKYVDCLNEVSRWHTRLRT